MHNKKVSALPWLVWLSELSASLGTKGVLVRFPVRVYAWVLGQVQQPIDVSLTHQCFSSSISPSLTLSLYMNKQINK